MRPLNIQNRILELLTIFVMQVKGAAAVGRTDINRISETILIPLFSEVYGYKNLKNLNYSEGINYPAIDLGDEVERVAFQITATTTSQKIKKTLEKFVAHKLYTKYDRLIIYILTEKPNYSGKGFEEIIDNHFEFNISKDIQDFRDIIREVESLQIEKAWRVQKLLEDNFGSTAKPIIGEDFEELTELVYLNMLEVRFPATIYVADVNLDRNQVVKNSRNFKIKVRVGSSTRNIIRAALEQNDMNFAVDWVCHEGKIVTFHDLNDDTLPLATVIDKGTITPLGTEEFYEIDENYERVFKSLLRRCLQQKLYHLGINWQYQDKLFIFTDLEDQAIRRETWIGGNQTGRQVFAKKMKDSNPDEILECKHLAFKTQFQLFDNVWYLSINPDWFFSYDGYKKSYYGDEKVAWLKARENNNSVFSHLRFIVHFIKNSEDLGEQDSGTPYPYLSFGEVVFFDNHPILDDKDWKPQKAN